LETYRSTATQFIPVISEITQTSEFANKIFFVFFLFLFFPQTFWNLISSLFKLSATITPASTVAAHPSFTPAADSKDKPLVVEPLKRTLKRKEDLDLVNDRRSSSIHKYHPQYVECFKKKVIYPPQQTKTKISRKTQTVTAFRPVRTSTSISTSITTSTLVPDEVSSTKSFKVTETLTKVETVSISTFVTSTTVATSFAPKETIYQACGSSNRESFDIESAFQFQTPFHYPLITN